MMDVVEFVELVRDTADESKLMRLVKKFLNIPQNVSGGGEERWIGLLLLMCDPSKNIRKVAEKAAEEHGYSSPREVYDDLSEGGKERVKEMIKSYSGSKDSKKRCFAAKAIGSLGLIDLVDELVNFRDHWDPKVRKSAQRSIEELGEKLASGEIVWNEEVKRKVTEVIKNNWRGDYFEERYAAAKFLAGVPEEEMDEDLRLALLPLMLDWYEDVRKAAEKAAKKHGYSSPQEIYYDDLSEGGKERVKEMIKSYSGSKDWGKRYAAAKLLDVIPEREMDEDLRLALLLLMLDRDKDVEKAAEEAAKRHGYSSPREVYDDLSEGGKERVKEMIKSYSGSKDSKKRCFAAKAIVALNLVDFIGKLLKLMTDWDLDVGERAYKAAKELVEKVASGEIILSGEVKKKVVEIIKNRKEDGFERYVTAKLLAGVPEEEMDEDLRLALLLLMFDWSEHVRKAAEEAAKRHGYFSPREVYDDLSEGGKERVKEMIKSYSGSKDSKKRCFAVEAIGSLGLIDLADVLVNLCHDLYLSISERALESIEKLGEKVASGEIVWNEEVKAKIIWKIGTNCLRDSWWIKKVAAKIIGSLGLIDLVGELVNLCDVFEEQHVREIALESIEKLGEKVASGKVAAKREHLDSLTNFFSKRAQYQDLVKKLKILRDDLNSTQIDADEAFGGRQQQGKKRCQGNGQAQPYSGQNI